MAENVVREALKQGLKTWIVTSERVTTAVAQLRENIEDVVVEARQEYEGRADTLSETDATTRPDVERSTGVVAPAPESAAPRARAKPKVSAVAASRPAPSRATARASRAKQPAGRSKR